MRLLSTEAKLPQSRLGQQVLKNAVRTLKTTVTVTAEQRVTTCLLPLTLHSVLIKVIYIAITPYWSIHSDFTKHISLFSNFLATW